jgi:DNA invertase Pin-like site-specific DNA recombinase
MRYFLARVSSKEQSLARQLKIARDRFDIPDENVFCDKMTGSSFDRPQYKRLKETVKAGDEVIVKEFDRFGRDKDEMKRELQWFKEKGVIVRILDIPTTLIDFQDQTWVLEMVNNILIEVLGAVAEQERKKTKQRQAEGIAAMPIVDGKRVSARTGRSFGRREKQVDEQQFESLLKQQKKGEITVKECCKQLGIGKSTWYERVERHANKNSGSPTTSRR